MNLDNKKQILENVISSENNFCEGFFVSKGTNRYILGINLSVAKTKKHFSHRGSTILDETNAFDLAEVAEANIGQINMITVSSYCGPKGLLWGYDICKTPIAENEWGITLDNNIKVSSIHNLVEAFKKLTGTVHEPRFPFFPGSHVPCAHKSVKAEGPGMIYTALAIGIPQKRERNACLLMEDIGMIPLDIEDLASYKKDIAEKAVKSIIQIGNNQKVEYKEIFIGVKELMIQKDEIGCALVAAPYLTLAKDAIPKSIELYNLTIDDWEKFVEDNFLFKHESPPV
ncbi:MAG: hypothetical protein GY754_07790 [bacterium]|nr:hypothetical protein [bacterium]